MSARPIFRHKICPLRNKKYLAVFYFTCTSRVRLFDNRRVVVVAFILKSIPRVSVAMIIRQRISGKELYEDDRII